MSVMKISHWISWVGRPACGPLPRTPGFIFPEWRTKFGLSGSHFLGSSGEEAREPRTDSKHDNHPHELHRQDKGHVDIA